MTLRSESRTKRANRPARSLPSAQSPTPAPLRRLELLAADGTVLAATLYTPSATGGRPPRGTLIIHAATATPQSYYHRFARFAAEALHARVLTYDYRGIGRSRPRSLRGFRATLTDWATLDARAVHDYVRDRFPAEPIALIGHSFGGQLVGLLDEAREAVAMVMVGSQLAYYRDWPRREQARLALIWHALVPALGALYGYLPGRFGLGYDLPRGVAAQWARWCTHPDYLVSEHPDAAQRFARFDTPTLLYSFSDDDFAPERAVSKLLARLPHAKLERAQISPRDYGHEPIGHFGFFRPRFEPTLWHEAVDFIAQAFDGRAPRRRPHPQVERAFHEEIMADLEYGRA